MNTKNSFGRVILALVLFHVSSMAADHTRSLEFRVGSWVQSKPLRACEDFTSIEPSCKIPYFAVFDGHGGVGAAELLQTELLKNLLDCCTAGGTLAITDHAITEAFRLCQDKIVAEKPKHCGSTAVACFFSSDERGHKLHVANVGDSHAVLVSVSGEGDLITTRLSTSHRPGNSDEERRIKAFKQKRGPKRRPVAKAMPVVTDTPKSRYVRGGQQNTRAKRALFCDKENRPHDAQEVPCPLVFAENSVAKEPLNSIAEKIGQETPVVDLNWLVWTGLEITRGFGHENLYPKGFTEEPSIVTHRIDKDDLVLILMTDGVHDHISDRRVAEIVLEKVQCGLDFNQIAREIVIEAAGYARQYLSGSHDDSSSLFYRIDDDMTVVIVSFE